MKRLAILFVFYLMALGAGNAFAEELYAIDNAPTYNGPSKQSGRFFFNPTAQKPLTLNKGEAYQVRSREGIWVQVDVFGRAPWVESHHLANTPSADSVKEKYKERLESFNYLMSTGQLSRIYAGVNQNDKELTLKVNSAWRILSASEKEGFVREAFILFMGMGGARGLKERPGDYKIKIVPVGGGRTLATWDDWAGFKEKK